METQELLDQYKELRKQLIENLTQLVKDAGDSIVIPKVISVDDKTDQWGVFCYIYKELIMTDQGLKVIYGEESSGDYDNGLTWIEYEGTESIVEILKAVGE